MANKARVLVDVWADIPDFRQWQGRRYSLTAVLSLTVAAILWLIRTILAIAEWKCWATFATSSFGF
jgi:hypothetical protein